MPQLTPRNGPTLSLQQIREVTTSAEQLTPALAENGMDEVLFEAEGKTYLGVSESLNLSNLKSGSVAQVKLGGETREAEILKTQDDITSFSEGWARGNSFGDSLAKAWQGMSVSPDWSAIHAQSQSVSHWPTPDPIPTEELRPVADNTEVADVEGRPAVQHKAPVELFFTEWGGNGTDQKLAEFIRSAEHTLDIAAFELESPVIRDAILDAHQAGRKVRVVTDSNYKDEHDIHALQAAGIEVIDDERSGLMHNKFVVVDEGTDQAAVWTGSMNFTENGVERNNNNALILRSPEMAENYGTEFREMFEDRSFGRTSPAVVPHSNVTVGHSNIRTYFSAEGDVAGEVARALNEAESSIHFMAFSYTHQGINEVVSAKMAEGVKVRGIFDNTQAGSRYSQYHPLKAAGADVRRDGSRGVMHHKVFIIDEKTVITGSFNFSKSANQRNDENLLIIEDEDMAAKYMQEFHKVYGEAKVPE